MPRARPVFCRRGDVKRQPPEHTAPIKVPDPLPQGELTVQTLKFDVGGMTCGGCTGSVQRALSHMDGVSHAEVSLRPGLATVVIDSDHRH